MEEKILKEAQILWNYSKMRHKLEKVDAIIVLGSHITESAEHGIELFKKGFAPIIIFSGGAGKITKSSQEKTEAESYKEIALKNMIPEKNIYVENESTNTRENILFTKKLAEDKNIKVKKIILVTDPYSERRAYATAKKLWPSIRIINSSPEINLEDFVKTYPRGKVSKKDLVNLVVAEVDRIIKLPDLGLQITQKVPDKVMNAYKKLIGYGYNKYLWKTI